MFCFAQEGEYPTYKNGLMYSEATMDQLGRIVDSLNLRFRSCELNRQYVSKRQAIGTHLAFEGKSMDGVRRAMDEGMGLEQVISQFRPKSIHRDVLLVRHDYKSGNTPVVEYEGFVDGDWDNPSIEFAGDASSTHLSGGQWIVGEVIEWGVGVKVLEVFHLSTPFRSTVLPERYARLVQYVDCLVDTTTLVTLPTAQLAEYGPPDLPEEVATLPMTEQITLLDSLRNLRVVGDCSQDEGPREHARNIALLAASTVQWEVFLRAHLDILNDRFPRMSDASNAWPGRETYLRELEELDIEVLDLMLGMSLRVENKSQNHYYGSVDRVGRALAETRQPEELEKRLFAMMADPELDDYNRVISYYLLTNYQYHLKDEKRKEALGAQIEEAVKTLPDYLAALHQRSQQ
jgi:hypothetical protein